MQKNSITVPTFMRFCKRTRANADVTHVLVFNHSVGFGDTSSKKGEPAVYSAVKMSVYTGLL